jgi:dipeptidyl aminopeptidase/acylaminoacyl peptidase
VAALAAVWAAAGPEPTGGLERLPSAGERSVASAGGVRAWSDGRDVWVVVRGGAPQNLTAEVDARVADVALARGGGLVAWSEDGTIVAWSPATGERRELFRGGWDPAVSPDGRTIAYVNQDVPDPSERAGFEARLGVLDVETGAARLVLLDVDATDPTFSPDGEQLAFMGGREGLATVRVNGRGLHVLEARGYTPLWDRPGRLVSSEPTPDGGSRLVALSLDDGGSRTLGEVPAGHVRALTLDGDEVRATVVVEHAGVERIEVGPGGVAGARRWLLPPDGWFTAPAIADDGRVAAATFRPSETVVVLGVAAPEVKVEGFAYARGPRWLPGGDLLFYGVERSGLLLAYRTGGAGRVALSAATGESVFFAVPTRDGRRVATTAEHGTRLLVFDVDRPWEDQLEQKRTAPAGWMPVDYGPDDALLVTDGVERLGVWRGGDVEVLREGSAWGVWSQDGARVLFAEGSALAWLDVATGETAPFVTLEGQLPLGEGFDLAPDDSFVVVTARTAEASSWRLR